MCIETKRVSLQENQEQARYPMREALKSSAKAVMSIYYQGMTRHLNTELLSGGSRQRTKKGRSNNNPSVVFDDKSRAYLAI